MCEKFFLVELELLAISGGLHTSVQTEKRVRSRPTSWGIDQLVQHGTTILRFFV